MNILKQNKGLFIGVTFIIVLFIGYGLFAGNAGGGSTYRRTAVHAGSSPIELQTIQLLRDVESVDLSSEIFSDPAFTVLRDFSRTVVSEPRGRNNPFAPLTAEDFATTTAKTISVQ